MASKVYTTKEMRCAADFVEHRDTGAIVTNCVIADMLRQAADAMEREEKREKNYEYAKKFANGEIFAIHLSNPIDTKSISPSTKVVSRPVGEWEEVKDGE